MIQSIIIKNLPDSDPDLTSSSLGTFGPKFDCILLHIQNFTRRRIYSAITKYSGVLMCVSCWINEFARHLFMDNL
jgi:hypothetical protein